MIHSFRENATANRQTSLVPPTASTGNGTNIYVEQYSKPYSTARSDCLIKSGDVKVEADGFFHGTMEDEDRTPDDLSSPCLGHHG